MRLGHFEDDHLGGARFVPLEADPDAWEGSNDLSLCTIDQGDCGPCESCDNISCELNPHSVEADQAVYDQEIDRRIDEWRETGIRPALPRRRA